MPADNPSGAGVRAFKVCKSTDVNASAVKREKKFAMCCFSKQCVGLISSICGAQRKIELEALE